eukprot:8382543-Pyramimonas_sp.AAC.1
MDPALIWKLRLIFSTYVSVSRGCAVIPETSLTDVIWCFEHLVGEAVCKDAASQSWDKYYLPVSKGFELDVVFGVMQTLGVACTWQSWKDGWEAVRPRHIEGSCVVFDPGSAAAAAVPHDVGVGTQRIVRKQFERASTLQRQLHVERKAYKRLETKLAVATNKIDILQQQIVERKSGQHLSYRAGMNVALRRITSRVSAARCGLSMGMDISSTTVTAWEIKADAALVASSRRFHATTADEHDCAIYFIRSDATNAEVWQRSKLMTVVTFTDYFSWDNEQEASRTYFADLQVVEGSTGRD